MTFPDKLSEAGKDQLAKQIDFFQALTTRAFENAERILALNLQTTRAALDQTSGAVRQLAEVRDPRDLLALTGQTQQQVEAAMAYSRKLFEIANQPAKAPAAPPAPDEHIDTAPPVKVSEPVAESAPAPVAATLDEPAEPAAAPEPVASSILPSKHPMGEADPEPEPAMTAKAKPIARAASKVAAAPVDTPHPAASPMPEAGPIVIPAITPVDAVATPQEATAPPEPKRAKGGKKR
jgi:phasin family protein